jgi:hypothetical protein
MDGLTDLPLVAKRVDYPPQAPAVFLSNWRFLRGAGLDRAVNHSLWILGHEQGSPGGTTDRRWAEPPDVRTSRGHPERGLTDAQLRHYVVAFTDAMRHRGPERLYVKVHRLTCLVNPQLRLDPRHRPTMAACPGAGKGKRSQILERPDMPHSASGRASCGRLTLRMSLD